MSRKVMPSAGETSIKPKNPTTAERKKLFIQTHKGGTENPYKILADCQYDIIAGTTFEEDGLSETIRLGFQNMRGISQFNLYWCEGEAHAIRPYQSYSLNSRYEIIGKNFSRSSRAIGMVINMDAFLNYLRAVGLARENGIYDSIASGGIAPPFGIYWDKKGELLALYDLNPYNKNVLKANKDELYCLKEILNMPSGIIIPLIYKKSLQGIVEIVGHDLCFDGDERNADSLIKYTTFMARVLAVHKRMQTDPLTRLLSKEVFEENLRKRIEEYLDCGKQFSLMYIDGDDFKKINDTYGHSVGDKILRNIAKKIFESTLPTDLNHRIGGEEFATITQVSPEIAVKIALRILKNVSEPMPVQLNFAGNSEDKVISKTVCIGIVDVATATSEKNFSVKEVAAEMKKLADAAMYKAKAEQGKNSIFFVERIKGKVEYKKVWPVPEDALKID